jgi:hypothetical protein
MPLLTAAARLVSAATPLAARAARPPLPTPTFTLSGALALVPDTPAIRAAGIWYNDFALAEQTYGVTGVRGMTSPLIARYFNALVALRPGPETGVSGLTGGRWRQVYGYDLLQITSEVYSSGAGTPSDFIAVDTGQMDLAYIAHVLVTTGYSLSVAGPGRVFVHQPGPAQYMPGRAVNAISLPDGKLVTGAVPADVITATRRMQLGQGVLADDPAYSAVAAALGPVDAAYVAANVPPSPYETSPFAAPPGGHRGRPLHHFAVFAAAYQEPRPGERVIELALAYPRAADAAADAATLRARFARESLPAFGARWAQVAVLQDLAARGGVLLARLRLRPGVPATLWQDAVLDGDLTILSS